MIGEVLVCVGAVLAAIAAIGAVRLDGVLARTHALTKAATGGITCAMAGAAIALASTSATTTLALALALQLFTFPVGANLVAHAVYKHRLDGGGRLEDDAPGEGGRAPGEGGPVSG